MFEFFGVLVVFVCDMVGELVMEVVVLFEDGGVVVIENFWFNLGEMLKDVVECGVFVVEFVKFGDVFVFDGFGVVYCK